MREGQPGSPPGPGEGYRWIRHGSGWLLECDRLAPLVHGWTSRTLADDARDPGGGLAGQLASLGGVAPNRVRQLRQVHGPRIVEAADTLPDDDDGADGVVTGDPSLLLTVRVADCVPLLIADTKIGAVGAVHAGWRGTLAGIAVRAVERMTALFGSRPANLVTALGPSIGPCCYEVGPDMRGRFVRAGWAERSVDEWFGTAGPPHLDLWRANRDQLIAAGVPGPAVLVPRLCTACHPEWFYSYRREAERTGRMFAFIRANGSGGVRGVAPGC